MVERESVFRVFLSHSHEDKAIAERLAKDLRKKSIDVWLDKWELKPGDNVMPKIEKAVREANHFMVLLTPSSLKSIWVQKETEIAVSKEIEVRSILIPVVYKIKPKDIPKVLQGLLIVDLNDYNKGLKQLINGFLGVSMKPPLGSKILEEKKIIKAYLSGLKMFVEQERSRKEMIDLFIVPSLRLRERKEMLEREFMGFLEPHRGKKEDSFVYKPFKMEELVKNNNNTNLGYSIVAGSGMGKTTLLEELALRIANGKIKTNLIPILLEFSSLENVTSSNSIINTVKDTISHWQQVGEYPVSKWLKEKRVLFLLDGLDQAIGRRSEFLKYIFTRNVLMGNRLIFCSRSFAYSRYDDILQLSKNFFRVEIDLFGESQIKDFLRDDYNEIIQAVSFSPELIRIPLLLSQIKALKKADSLVSIKGKIDLYNKIIDRFFVSKKEWGILSSKVSNKENLVKHFQILSFYTFSTGNIFRFPRSLYRNVIEDIKIEPIDFDSLLQFGIIHQFIEGNEKEFSYRHQSFQEYFASLELKEKLFENGNIDMDVFEQYLENRSWDEVWLFLVGGLDEVQAREVIRLIGSYDNLLAAKCLTVYKGQRWHFNYLIDKLFDEITNDKVTDVLATLADSEIETRLIGWLNYPEHNDFNFFVRSFRCGYAARVLGKIKAKKAAKPLIKLLDSNNFLIFEFVAEALWEINAEEAIQPLIKQLDDKNPMISSIAANVLGKFRAKEAVTPLINILRGAKDAVSGWVPGGSVSEALVKIKSEEDADDLLELFADDRFWVRLNATYAYQKITSKNQIEVLFGSLKKETPVKRAKIAEVLGVTNLDNLVDFAIELLKTGDPVIRLNSAQFLEKIKAVNAIEPLMVLLEDENTFVYQSAAEALINIKQEEIVRPLIERLERDRDIYKFSVPYVLGGIATKFDTSILQDAVPLLISLLEDNDTEVRKGAVWALSKIKHEDAAYPMMRLLADTDVCWSVAEALKSMKSQVIIKSLIGLLNHRNYHVLSVAVGILGEMKAEEAMDPLVQLLKNKSEKVRKAAIRALGEISASLKQEENDKLIKVLYKLSGKRSFGRRKVMADVIPKALEEIKESSGRRLIKIGKQFN